MRRGGSPVAALVAALGAFIAWRHLPDRGGAQVDGSPEADADIGGPLLVADALNEAQLRAQR